MFEGVVFYNNLNTYTMKYILFVAIGFASIMLPGCKKDESGSNNQLNEKTFVVNATKSSEWVYFSFEKDDTLKIVDRFTSTDWDLAFRRFYIRSNGGLSGPGNVGADSTMLTGSDGFTAYKLVSDTAQFNSDINMRVMTFQGFTNDTVNPVLYTWFNYDFAINQLVPSNKIFVFRTAKGKYAKLWFKSYYSDLDGTTPGFIKFTYIFQGDGSKNFQ
jgi:hypothetical protein